MKTFKIVVNKDCFETSINDFEKEYLKKNLEEIIFVESDKNKKIKNMLGKKLLGYKTNRIFKKVRVSDKNNETKENERIRCECRAFLRKSKKKYTKSEYSFNHKNYCNKNVSNKKTNCYFIFKNNSNIKKKFTKSNSKKHLIEYLKNENLKGNDYNYCKYCLEITEKNFRKEKKYDLIKMFQICPICFEINDDKLIDCKFCENKIHIKCMGKKNGCTCKKTDKFFENKINDFSIISKIINEKYIIKRKKKLNLKLPPESKELFNIVDLLKEKKNLDFNDDLYYEIDNRLSNLIEYGHVELEDNDKQIYYKLKEQTSKGNYNYIKIENHIRQGYIVVANTDMQKNTLLCEYAGNVLSLQEYYKKYPKTKGSKNDSIMDLTITPFCETTLIICPYTCTNLGKFFSGVNNNDKESMKKINVFSVKILIDGSLHILLITSKNIKKGDILYYNYNADGNNYPTSEFE